MEVARRRHAQPTLERGAEVGDDVAEQVVGDNHLELAGIEHHVHRQCVDVIVRGGDPRELRDEFLEHALPQGVSLRHRVAFVGHAHLCQPVGLGILERVTHDPVHAFISVDLFLDRHFVIGAGFEPPTNAHVDAFGVLAEHDEVDVFRRSPLEWAEPLVEQLHGPVVHVEIELEARAEQDVARVPVVRHARITQRANEHRIELPQQVVAVRRHRLLRFQVVVRTPRQVLELELLAERVPYRLQHFDRFGRNFFTDAVPGDDRYTHSVTSTDSRSQNPSPQRNRETETNRELFCFLSPMSRLLGRNT